MRNSRKTSYIDWLCTNFATVNIFVFIVSELLAALAALLGLPAPRWRRNENGDYDTSDEWAEDYVYRSSEMERRQIGISDRRRRVSAPSKRLPVPGKSERRTKSDRRATPWDLHPA